MNYLVYSGARYGAFSRFYKTHPVTGVAFAKYCDEGALPATMGEAMMRSNDCSCCVIDLSDPFTAAMLVQAGTMSQMRVSK
jgi:hypothetical protein